MFKQVGEDHHLYVRPGESIWSVARELNDETIWLKGGRASQSCPAHPSSSLNQEGDASNWKTDKGVKGGVLLRCSIHDAIHSKWLVKQGREGLISKGKGAALLCEEDNEGNCLLSLLDSNVQQEVATWNQLNQLNPTEKIAHKLSFEFVQWLVKQKMDGHWEGRGSVVWRKNKEGTVIFSLLDFETQKWAATMNPEATETISHMQSLEFIQWLIRQKLDGHWKGNELGSVVWRKNKEGTLVFSQLYFETQKQVAYWSQEETNKNAHLASVDFLQWLLVQARDGKWPKENVASIVCRKNADNQLILATLDEETRKEVAVFNKAITCSAVPYMEKEGHFLEWLYQEAVQGRWEEQLVFKALIKEEFDGRVEITPRIKPGMSS